jgi:hypothetical protein
MYTPFRKIALTLIGRICITCYKDTTFYHLVKHEFLPDVPDRHNGTCQSDLAGLDSSQTLTIRKQNFYF